MTTHSIWLVGSILVPLAAVATFAILYFRRYKQYLLDKNSLVDTQFLEDLCRGYVFARVAYNKARKSRFWWYFFGPRYIDLVNFNCQRFLYELDKLDSFENPDEHYPTFRRKSFMGQWVEMHKIVMEDSYYDDDIQFSVNPSHGKDPFGWMSVIIAGKMFELYRKHALYLLRTKGYIAFDMFLRNYHDKSNQYPLNIPFSKIFSERFHCKIVSENSTEISEKIHSEIKKIRPDNRKSISESERKLIQSLADTFLISYWVRYVHFGLSEVRKEIFELLKKEKVVVA